MNEFEPLLKMCIRWWCYVSKFNPIDFKLDCSHVSNPMTTSSSLGVKLKSIPK